MRKIPLRKAVGALTIVSCSLLTGGFVAHADGDDEGPPPQRVDEIVVTAPRDGGNDGGGGGGIDLPGGGGGETQPPPQEMETVTVTSVPLTPAEKAELNAAIKGAPRDRALRELHNRGFDPTFRVGVPPDQIILLQRATPRTNIRLTCNPDCIIEGI